MHFENCSSIYTHVPVLLVSLVIDVELVQEGLDITLILYGQKDSLELLSEGHIIVASSLAYCISASSAIWWGYVPLPMVFWLVTDPLAFAIAVFLTPPILFLSLVLFPTPYFGYSSI